MFYVDVGPVIVANKIDIKDTETIKVSSKKQSLVYKIDLTKLGEQGDFLCPSCKIHISPDDETEKVYTILEPEVKNNKLESLLIRCNNCTKQMLLTGFSVYDI